MVSIDRSVRTIEAEYAAGEPTGLMVVELLAELRSDVYAQARGILEIYDREIM